MFRFFMSLLRGVARGLGWAARQALGLVGDTVEGLFTGLWRQLFPPPVEEQESTAEVLRQVAGLITEQGAQVEGQAQREMPVPRPMSEARMRRVMTDALRYTTARLHGERLPSLAHVPAEMAHELHTLSPADTEVMHRQLIVDLGLTGPGWWDGPTREVHVPGHDEAPALRYA